MPVCKSIVVKSIDFSCLLLKERYNIASGNYQKYYENIIREIKEK